MRTTFSFKSHMPLTKGQHLMGCQIDWKYTFARTLLNLLLVSLTLVFGENSQAQTVTYIHTDGLGSPVAKSDASGNIIANSRTRYEPYGMPVAGTATPTIGFTGHVNDADTDLTYMQQRYYDAIAGRFLSTDPVLTDYDSGASFNRYNYAGNNPYKYIDPDGRSFCGAYQCDVIGEGGSSSSTNGGVSNGDTRPKESVGLGESLIPIWGSAKQSKIDFENGEYAWGTVNGLLAVSDVFLVKSLLQATGKGIWKTGSNSWSATRSWYGKTRELEPNTQVHHWFIEQNSQFGKNVPNWIKNQPWNLNPIQATERMTSLQRHIAVHGKGPDAYNMFQRITVGTPDWAIVLQINALGKTVNAVGH